MPRAPNEKIEKAKELFDKGCKMVEISVALSIPEGTVRSWKKRYQWDATLQTKKRNVANKKGGQPGNKNSVGHKPSTPEENKNAERHGFFSKWLPAETMEIMNCIERSSPIDLLWDNIQLQYAAIIRAQNLMYVRDQEDMTKEISCDGLATSYDIQQAWDKHSNFMQAQSRAMKTLESMIKQYDGLTRSDLVTEEQRARIDKLKADVAKINGEEESYEDDGFLDALSGKIGEVWEAE
ncbi:phage terminase small subunit [Acetobacterium sp.]|uniref:phage terminase small subunit n=1 Tax=Acetobacterium sp. TaxID=1872094 RepID=UPI00271EB94B|nr:phage terminase small subunit [Acetobacterium sp.]MDO9492814.1 phage terminase small subunit [Acetobacterium sp.]